MKKRICGSAPSECVLAENEGEDEIMDKHEPSTIKQKNRWNEEIAYAISEWNARFLQPHNPRERICTQRLKTTPPPAPLRRRGTAFTLAEVLITLSIIGVVAALTIPTLIQRTGDEEMVSKLMKAYSTFSQATEAIITEQGSPKVWNTDVDSLYKTYKSHIRNAKDCGSGTGCFKQGAIKYLDGKTYNWDWETSGNNIRKLILSDGVQVLFAFKAQDCSVSGWGTNNMCAQIAVDLNGEKAPNQFGRDVFVFDLKADGLYPNGCDNEKAAQCNTNGHGTGCACKVIAEGAMNY